MKTNDLTLSLFIFGLLMSLPYFAHSQQRVNLEIRVLKIGNRGYEPGESRKGYGSFRFYLGEYSESNRTNLFKQDICFTTQGTHEERELDRVSAPYPIDLDLQDASTNGSVDIVFVSHNERRNNSSDCSVNSGGGNNEKDKYEVKNTFTFELNNILPGVFSEPKWLENRTGGTYAYALVQIRYSMPQPNLAERVPETGLVCSDRPLRLQTNVPLNIKGNLRYVWEYYVEGDTFQVANPSYEACVQSCTELAEEFPETNLETCLQDCGSPLNTLQNWQSLDTTNEDKITFILAEVLDTIFRQNQRVKFRVKAISMEMESPMLEFNYIDFSPVPPTLGEITISPSCPNASTGSILIEGIKGFTAQGDSSFLYILQEGFGKDSATCDPRIRGDNGCASVVDFGLLDASKVLIDSIPRGEYSLWVGNPGESVGLCFTSLNVSIPAEKELGINLTKTDVSCQGAMDGTLTIRPLNGVGGILDSLKDRDTGSLIGANQGIYEGLAPGFYEALLYDECGQEAREIIQITEPKRVQASFEIESATCLSPGNGALLVQINNAPNSDASSSSGRYDYQLFREGELIARLDSTSADTWQVEDLALGNYRLAIKDAKRPTCPGFGSSFEIKPPFPLNFAEPEIRPISCFGGSDGAIQIEAAGGVGLYTFILKKLNPDTTTYQNESGFFENLLAGIYTLELKSGLLGCRDAILYPDTLVITEPNEVGIAYEVQNLTCEGDKNGAIKMQVHGGNELYTYTWEKLIGGSWNSLASSTPVLENLSGGLYRARLQDLVAGCTYTSDTILVFEPEPLEITELGILRESCEAELATLSLKAQGGKPPYNFTFAPTSELANEYTTLTADTQFAVGTYFLKVIDSLGCEGLLETPLEILPNAISVQVDIVPACFQKSDAKITVQASGGVPPYLYGLSVEEGNNFQPEPSFEGLTSGIYSLTVRDRRGCIGSQQVEVPNRPDEPEARFLVATRENALDTLIVKEVSVPKPDSVNWHFDPATIILSLDDPFSPEIQFAQPGTYQMGMTAFFGNCSYRVDKTLNVQSYDSLPNIPNPNAFEIIEELGIYPNPNNGVFEVKVKMSRAQILVLMITDLEGKELYRKRWEDIDRLDERVSLGSIPSGTYLLQVLTDNDAREIRIVVSQ